MAVGFWSKLVDLAKKIWGGIKKGSEVVQKYIMPVAKQATSLLSKSDNKSVAQMAGDLHEGLGKISPLVRKLAITRAKKR